MKRTKTYPLKELLQEYIRTMKMQTKFNEAKVINEWENIVGKVISKMTQEIFIHNKKLFVRLNSSIAKNELMMIKEALKDRINRENKVIEDIVFL